ncbi:thioredoxin-like protein YneN [Pullulanibacillus camelliae]|uniref:Thioredoxin-like protein YneN n=1 Tax=Pullulanibacillus camelliae TaxID=1707096 RepID=A0A8J2VR79_9BACL|nr:thiol-disulfide oxidoreductase ResA [Pullulanibacillus camelliae]GGE38422.1 thioredoxin-like protein YneN [Pullulanibacillus camelliae]
MSQKRKRFFINAFIILIILIALGYTGYRMFFKTSVVHVGDTAPDFTVQNLNGREMTLSSLEGKGVMLNFWQSDCDPCKEEMPFINKAYHTLQSNDNVVILSVNVDESKSIVKHFKDTYHLDFPVWLDHKKVGQDLYGIRGIPTTYLIDSKGKVVDIVQGYMDGKSTVMKKLKEIRP